MVDNKSVNNFNNEVDDDTMSSVYNAWRKNQKNKTSNDFLKDWH